MTEHKAGIRQSLIKNNQNYGDNYNDDHYKQVLSETASFINNIFFVNMMYLFIRSIINTIWPLYARGSQFNTPSYKSISTVLYISICWQGICGSMIVSISNKFGYSKGIMITLIINITALCLQIFTNNFIMSSVGYVLSHTPVYNISVSSIAWFLPHKYTSTYMSRLNMTSWLGLLLGPAFTGIVVKYIKYEWLWGINCMLGAIVFTYFVIFIGVNGENKLLEKQLKIKYKGKQNDDIKFPVYIKKKHDYKLKRIGKQTKMSLFEYIILFISIFLFSMGRCAVRMMSAYLALFVDAYLLRGKEAASYASYQLAVLALGQLIAHHFIPIVVKKTLFLKYMVSLITSVSTGLMMFFIFTEWNQQNKNIYYGYTFGCGLLFGSVWISSQLIRLEFQPPSKSGFISGTTVILATGNTMVGFFFVGEYWNKIKSILFYIILIVMMFSSILSLLMGIIHFCYNRCFASNKYRYGKRGNESTTLQTVKPVSTLHSIND